MELIVSNMVMGITFSSELNLPNIFELLPCVHIPGYSRNKDKEIPFFGVKNCIVSIQKENEFRGIRINGAMKNMVCIDYQNECKNIHIKISKNKFHLTGPKSYEMGINTASNCLNFIKKIDRIWWSFFTNLTDEYKRYVADWAIYLLKKEDDSLKMFNDPTIDFDILPDEIKEYKEIIQQFHLFTYDYPTIEMFTEKVNRVLKIVPCTHALLYYGDTIEISSVSVYNSVYDYNCGKELSLIALSQKLTSLNYQLSYHNTINPNQIMVIIPIVQDLENAAVYKTKKVPSHRFEINANGSIRQTSPTMYDAAREKYLEIIKLLTEDVTFQEQ